MIARISFAALVVLTTLVSGCNKGSSVSASRPVVKVDDRELSVGSLADQLSRRLRDFHILTARDSAVITQTKNAIVQDFIVRAVTEAWAQEKSIFVRKEQLEEEMLRTRKFYPDDVSFRKALAKDGVSYDLWEDQTRFSILEKLVAKDIVKSLPDPPTKELVEYYDANKTTFQRPAAIQLRQIVSESETNAERIRKELIAGKNFASMAKKFSIGPEASSGGELGWIEKGTLEVFDHAFKLGQNQRSQAIKSPYGYHIFEVLQKRTAKTLSFEEVKDRIRLILLEERERKAYASWLEEQILKARVYKDDELLSSITVHPRGDR